MLSDQASRRVQNRQVECRRMSIEMSRDSECNYKLSVPRYIITKKSPSQVEKS